jgi:DNA repair protein RadC
MKAINPSEYKVIALRECPCDIPLCDTPALCAEYWHKHIESDARFNPEVETMVCLMLNTRRRIKGHYVVATGTQDTILAHPREIFRVAIVAAASAIILMHNHPSGESMPSEADIYITRQMLHAGQLLKIDLLDHVIVGRQWEHDPLGYTSLRDRGYFYS